MAYKSQKVHKEDFKSKNARKQSGAEDSMVQSVTLLQCLFNTPTALMQTEKYTQSINYLSVTTLY